MKNNNRIELSNYLYFTITDGCVINRDVLKHKIQAFKAQNQAILATKVALKKLDLELYSLA